MALNGGNPDPHDRTGEHRQAAPCPLCGESVYDTARHIRNDCEGVDDV
jgi:hypothetical protein